MYKEQTFRARLARKIKGIPAWLWLLTIYLSYFTLLHFIGQGFAALFVALIVASASLISSRDREQNKVKNIMALFDVNGEKLRVGLEQVPNKKLKRVAVGEYDEEYAILQFPFNYQVSSDHLFPIQQLGSVREFFKTNYPQVELIT